MNRLRTTIGILAILSLLFGQCQCPTSYNEPQGGFNTEEFEDENSSESRQLEGSWETVGAKWTFKAGGELLVIKNNGKEVKGFWAGQKEGISIVFNGLIQIYKVEKLSETQIKFYNETSEIIFNK